jgi:hypothetical protein
MNSRLKKGAFTLSIDVEPDTRLAQDSMCQEVIGLLLELMERYEIRATWAVLGEMLLDKHQDKTAALVNGAPSWKGKNVVQQIMSCKAPQEIGCHTFSHIRVGDPSCTREQFEAELKACQKESERFGVKLLSFVFPWNSVGHLDSLREFGFISYRSSSPTWFSGWPASLRRLAHLVDHWMLIPSPIPKISCEKGVWNLPDSYFCVMGSGWGKMIPISLRVFKAKQGLRLAAKNQSLVHLWFHPFNLYSNTKVWLKGFEAIFAEVRRYQDAGLVENLTMGELASKLQLQK